IEEIGDVRGKGLMIGVELVKNRKTKEPASDLLSRVLLKAFKRGLLLIGGGRSVIRIAPPLSISEEALDRGLEILEEVLREETRK
ncbi:MAG TPA: aminotransferase class III-fold pyridoxal phosphate-dependent enzyme, partial [Thermofilum sp.]|nr:aminotransferase class III-fold pyridoxal phosphate-dependent enzyme [Thermofilum sp.]